MQKVFGRITAPDQSAFVCGSLEYILGSVRDIVQGVSTVARKAISKGSAPS